MGWFLEIIDTHNHQQLGSIDLSDPIYWRLDHEVELALESDAAWCHRCQDFVMTERLPTIAAIEEKLKLLADESTDSRLQSKRVERWRVIREWRINRKSPPRCLVCGSMFGVVPLGEDCDKHPGNPARPISTTIGHYFEMFPTKIKAVYYDAEGNRLPNMCE
jgi:hypothetical protein